MNGIDVIFCLIVTVVLGLRLWSVLGQRGEDDQGQAAPPDPFEKSARARQSESPDEEDVMVLQKRLPPRDGSLSPNGYAASSLAGTIDRLRAMDPAFEEKSFLDGAKIAFQKIVGAFGAGDLGPVRRLLSPAVEAGFQKALDERESEGAPPRFEAIKEAEVVAAKLDESRVQLTVRFLSIQKQANGRAEEIEDFWVFHRDLRHDDPNWCLVETRA